MACKRQWNQDTVYSITKNRLNSQHLNIFKLESKSDLATHDTKFNKHM